MPNPRSRLSLARLVQWYALALALMSAAGCATTKPSPEASTPRPGFELQDTTASEVHAYVSRGAARATLVNVWSTWCDPCVEEMPELLGLREELHPRGFELVLVSADFESARDDVVAFLAERGVDYRTFLKVQPDQEFIKGIHADWSGTLPLSLLFDRHGQLVRSWQGKIHGEDVRTQVMPLLASP